MRHPLPPDSPEVWDVILVGSGLTSLAFAAQTIAKYGSEKRVLVLEKHYVPGGYASVFKRKKARYDCSLHKLAGLRSGNTRRILDGLGMTGELDLTFHDSYFQFVHAGQEVTLPNDVEGFKQVLYERFPAERAGLDQYFRDVEVHGKNGYHQFQMMSGTYMPEIEDLRYAHKVLKNVSVLQALTKLVQSPLLREVLAAPCVYAGGYADDLSYFYYLHIIYASLYCGTGYIVGGSQKLSNLFVDRVRAARGAVLLRTEVSEVLVDGEGRAEAVVTPRGIFRARHVVLNCSPTYSVTHLFRDQPGLERVKESLEQLRPSWSTTTLYCEMRAGPETGGLSEPETMLLPRDLERGYELRKRLSEQTSANERGRALAEEALWEEALWKEGLIMVTNYHLLDPSGGKVMQLNILDEMSHWPEAGTAEYLEKKRRCTQILLERLFEAKPQLRGLICRDELSTPHTYERYTNNFRGAGYGAMVGTSLKGHMFHRGFPIKNVHFMSSWVAGPSYEAALGYSEMRARSFVF